MYFNARVRSVHVERVSETADVLPSIVPKNTRRDKRIEDDLAPAAGYVVGVFAPAPAEPTEFKRRWILDDRRNCLLTYLIDDILFEAAFHLRVAIPSATGAGSLNLGRRNDLVEVGEFPPNRYLHGFFFFAGAVALNPISMSVKSRNISDSAR